MKKSGGGKNLGFPSKFGVVATAGVTDSGVASVPPPPLLPSGNKAQPPLPSGPPPLPPPSNPPLPPNSGAPPLPGYSVPPPGGPPPTFSAPPLPSGPPPKSNSSSTKPASFMGKSFDSGYSQAESSWNNPGGANQNWSDQNNSNQYDNTGGYYQSQGQFKSNSWNNQSDYNNYESQASGNNWNNSNAYGDNYKNQNSGGEGWNQSQSSDSWNNRRSDNRSRGPGGFGNEENNSYYNQGQVDSSWSQRQEERSWNRDNWNQGQEKSWNKGDGAGNQYERSDSWNEKRGNNWNRRQGGDSWDERNENWNKGQREEFTSRRGFQGQDNKNWNRDKEKDGSWNQEHGNMIDAGESWNRNQDNRSYGKQSQNNAPSWNQQSRGGGAQNFDEKKTAAQTLKRGHDEQEKPRKSRWDIQSDDATDSSKKTAIKEEKEKVFNDKGFTANKSNESKNEIIAKGAVGFSSSNNSNISKAGQQMKNEKKDVDESPKGDAPDIKAIVTSNSNKDWASEYERMKQERLNKGKSNTSVNKVGESSRMSTFNSTSSQFSNKATKEQTPPEKVGTKPPTNPLQMISNSYDEEDEGEQEDAEEKVDIHRPGANRPSQKKDPTDPWFAVYEAKKKAALKNMETKNLQSVTGASAFCGKIDGVNSLTSQNQVTRLMKKLKKDEKAPKLKFVNKDSDVTPDVPEMPNSMADMSSTRVQPFKSQGLTGQQPNNQRFGNRPPSSLMGASASRPPMMGTSTRPPFPNFNNSSRGNMNPNNQPIGRPTVSRSSEDRSNYGAKTYVPPVRNEESSKSDSAFSKKPPPPPSAFLGSFQSKNPGENVSSAQNANKTSQFSDNLSGFRGRDGGKGEQRGGQNETRDNFGRGAGNVNQGSDFGRGDRGASNANRGGRGGGFGGQGPRGGDHQNSGGRGGGFGGQGPRGGDYQNSGGRTDWQQGPGGSSDPRGGRGGGGQGGLGRGGGHGAGRGGGQANAGYGQGYNDYEQNSEQYNNSSNYNHGEGGDQDSQGNDYNTSQGSYNYGQNTSSNNYSRGRGGGNNFGQGSGQNRGGFGFNRQGGGPLPQNSSASYSARPQPASNQPPLPPSRPPATAPSAAGEKAVKRDLSFAASLKNTKVDSKKDSMSWQEEYEARKRARLQGNK